jgi:signal transduction histidine kinase
MKLTPVAVIGSLLVLLLTWLLVKGLDRNSDHFDRELRALDDFSRFERGFNREVLAARVGLARNYDALVHMTEAYDDALDRLSREAGPDSEERDAVEALAGAADRQEKLIEQFKSRNALLHNSFAYFGMLSGRLAASDRVPVVEVTSTLAAAMLHLTLDTSPAAASEVKDRLNELASLQTSPGESDTIQGVIAHGRMLHDLLPATDAVLRALVAAASNREQDADRSLIMKHQLAARASASRYRLFLYATSLLLLGVLVYFGLQLRARAIALRRRAAFEHVIAGISTRFINSQPHEIAEHVESALEKLAECVGADRAYFVIAGESKQLYRWSRQGIEFPQGWPERASQIAAHFNQGDGVIHIPKVRPSHPYDKMHLLVEAGLQGWLCIPSTCRRRSNAILGFDALHSGALTQWTEVTLFRMAFDAIGGAVGRAVLEREKERLEASLQQAHRMETIGTFASGIAHNFNNIVGAILGYAEMADAHIRGGGLPAASLAEIRRAGERAGELVDQILTFGRRGEGRRAAVCMKALIAETRSLLGASLPSHVELRIHETSENAIVWGEPAQLQQVILNVCNNAAQAMDDSGAVEIQIDVQETKHPLRIGDAEIGPGRFTIVSISDSGRGMDRATLERIFDPFFTTRPEGNGLGLATVREIVRTHDGAMNVQSAIGAGSRFDVWLPCASSDEPVTVRSDLHAVDRGIGETVLVLEADRGRLLRHEEILAALGYEPVGFTDLAEAAAACRAEQKRFDAALVCHQPGTTSVLDSAAALNDVAPSLPIILATFSARTLGAPSLVNSGVSELISYPVTSSELAAALSRCLMTSIRPQLQA